MGCEAVSADVSVLRRLTVWYLNLLSVSGLRGIRRLEARLMEDALLAAAHVLNRDGSSGLIDLCAALRTQPWG
jgi:hypothetical protein